MFIVVSVAKFVIQTPKKGVPRLTDSLMALINISFSLLQVIESLGIIIYKALDYGLKDNEERELSPPLEQLIDHMTNTTETVGSRDEGYDALDEGEEDDNDDDQEEVEAIHSYKDVMKVQ